MTKAATKSAENVEFPTFDASEATDQIRAFAEKSVEQSKEVYEKVRTAAEDVQKTLEASFENSRAAADEVGRKALAALRANADAGFDHVEALMGVKSLSEMMELQTSFMRKSFEMATAQARDFQAITTRAAEDMTRPVKGMFEKSMKELKAA